MQFLILQLELVMFYAAQKAAFCIFLWDLPHSDFQMWSCIPASVHKRSCV